MQRSRRVSNFVWWLPVVIGLVLCVVCSREEGTDRLKELSAPELPSFDETAATSQPAEGTGDSVPTEQAPDPIEEVLPLQLDYGRSNGTGRAPVSHKARPQS